MEILQGLTQNLETSLNYKVRKRANLVNTILRIAIFLITGIAFVFSWTFLADELPYSDRPDFLTIITNVTVIAGSIVLGSLIYFQDEGFKEEEDFLSILKDAQILMKKDSSI
ncbi:hypothetical protein [Tetragenococcus halophilus]|uniref:Uncharacterized protein n=1 Tax=Tetragenococcus halophilus TaxID=51669 RepID=A0AB37D1V7_TETHA|nr:hypothetical protein [Tetragenococcus halophilus]QGP75898.1 hypothetical protein GLW17_03100 [Tetragenococcus halophilus]